MRAMANDQRINAAKFAWAGERNNSQSILLWNGKEVRRNLCPDPFRTSGISFGPNGVGTQQEVLDSRFAGGRAFGATWTTLPTGPWAYAVISNNFAWEIGKTYAVSVKTAGNVQLALSGFVVSGINGPNISISKSANVVNLDGTITRRALVTYISSNGSTAHSLLFFISAHTAILPTSFWFGETLIEEGTAFSPFFSGDTLVTADTLDLLSLSDCSVSPHEWGLAA